MGCPLLKWAVLSLSIMSVIGVTPQDFGDGVLCKSCIYMKNNYLYQTDGSGAVKDTVSCMTNYYTQTLCKHKNLNEPLTVIPGGGEEVCKSKQYPRECTSKDIDPVTIWGDGRSDPSYITDLKRDQDMLSGKYHDWDDDDWKLLAHRTKTTRTHPNELYEKMGEPDIYAYKDRGIWSTLVDGLKNRYPVHGLFNETSTDNYGDNIPLFKNQNGKLFLYIGAEDNNFVKPHLSGSCKLLCIVERLYKYLIGHEKINTVTEIERVSHLVTHGFTPSEETSFLNIFKKKYSCRDKLECYNGITDGQSEVIDPTHVRMVYNRENFRSFGLYIDWMSFGFPFKSATELKFNGMSRPESAVLIYTHLYKNHKELTYPFLIQRAQNYYGLRKIGSMNFYEQSADGINWVLHPQTLNTVLHKHYNNRDFHHMLKNAMKEESQNICQLDIDKSNICLIPIGVEPGYKYLRLVTVIGMSKSSIHIPVDDNPNPTNSERGVFILFPPMTALVAEAEGSTKLFVMPSAHPANNFKSMELQCKNIEGCTYLEPISGKLYPSDGKYKDKFYGSLTMREKIKSIIPKLFDGCEKLMKDPIEEFLKNPQITTRKCYQQKFRPHISTCYYTAPSTYRGNDFKFSKQNGEDVYELKGYKLFVQPQNKYGNYPQPILTLGSFTPNAQTPTGYVYNHPVMNSYNKGNFYVTTDPICDSNNQTNIKPLKEVPADNCTCLVKIDIDNCLCMDLQTYSYVPSFIINNPGTSEQNCTDTNNNSTTSPFLETFVTNISFQFRKDISLPLSIAGMSISLLVLVINVILIQIKNSSSKPKLIL